MNKLSNLLEKYLMPLGERLDRIKFLQVIRQALMGLIPITISGSIVLIILNFPFIDSVVPESFMTMLNDMLNPLFNSSFALISMYLVFLIGYNYSLITNKDNDHKMPGLVALVSFIIMTPAFTEVDGNIIGGVIPTSYLGASGMFVAIIIGYISAAIYCKLLDGNLKIKLPESVPSMVSDTFSSLIPAFITLVVISIGNYLMLLTPFENIHNFVTSIIQAPLMNVGTGVTATVLSQGLIQMLWFFGLQGDDLVGSITKPILTAASGENLTAFNAGADLPYIITQQFVELFVFIGFISLVIAILIVARSSRLKEVGKLSAGPATFGISEPTVFGVPVVMNFLLFIPWVLIRPIFVLITYGSMYFGICPPPTGVILPWTTPPLLSGFLATNSIMGSVVQLVCLIVGVLIFIPFVKAIDNKYRSEEVVNEN